MKKQSLLILVSLITVFTISCNKDDLRENHSNIRLKSSTSITTPILNATDEETKWGWGWTVFDLKDKCEFCPFWFCKGTWDPIVNNPIGPDGEHISRVSIENGHFVAEIYASNDELPTVLSNISNGKIQFISPNNNEPFITIPPFIVNEFQLSDNKIYPGLYDAELVPNTNRVKVTF